METEVLILFGDINEYRVKKCQPAIIRQEDDEYVIYENIGNKLRFVRSYAYLESAIKYTLDTYAK